MYRLLLVVCLCIAQVTCFPHHENDEARVLSEVWDAMEKHKGNDIIVIPRRDEPSSEHHDSGPSGPSHGGPSHDGPSHDGPSHDGPSDRSEGSSSEPKSESSPDTPPAESSPSSERSEESSKGNGEFPDKMWEKFNRLGDMMSRAVERLRKDDREFREIEENGESSGLTVFILEIVGGVVVGLILVSLLIFGFVKGLRGFKTWKARRQSERLVDQEAPNMDGTGYQSGYNP